MTNNYSSSLTETCALQYNNNNKKEVEGDLPKLGRKKSSIRKSVSFNKTISITQVENWKKYNSDATMETELYKLKQQINEYKKRKLEKEKNECCCGIF